jgi:hypothetical protein
MSRNKLRRIDKEALINLGSQGLSFLLDLGSNEFTEIPADFVNLTYVSDLYEHLTDISSVITNK